MKDELLTDCEFVNMKAYSHLLWVYAPERSTDTGAVTGCNTTTAGLSAHVLEDEEARFEVRETMISCQCCLIADGLKEDRSIAIVI